jgi:hypothetical protein
VLAELLPVQWWSPNCWRYTTRGGERLAVAAGAEFEVVAALDLAELLAVQWSPRAPSCGTSAASSRRSPMRQARGRSGRRFVVAELHVGHVAQEHEPGARARGGRRSRWRCCIRHETIIARHV